MTNVPIRNLPDDVRQALKVREALNNRSAEAEIRGILTAAVQPMDLEQMGRAVGLETKPAKK